jgi:hypothetical protein
MQIIMDSIYNHYSNSWLFSEIMTKPMQYNFCSLPGFNCHLAYICLLSLIVCWFHHLTSQIRDNKIGICCFFYLQESMEFSKYKALIYVPFCTILQHFYWWFWRKILFKDLLNFPLLDQSASMEVCMLTITPMRWLFLLKLVNSMLSCK